MPGSRSLGSERVADGRLAGITALDTVLTGIPSIAQFVHVGKAAALADIEVAYPGEAELTVTLEVLAGLGRVGGVLGGLTDGDEDAPGIQLTGTAEEISAALAEATFTADAIGQGHLRITVNDGQTSATSHYAFTAVAAPVNTAPTFAVPQGTGKLLVPVGNGYDFGQGVVVQDDGKIVVAGRSENDNGGSAFSFIRLNTDGSLDTGFGGHGTGMLLVPAEGGDGFSLVVQPDRKIVVAGYSKSAGRDDFSLIRLNADGLPDASFGEGGLLLMRCCSALPLMT